MKTKSRGLCKIAGIGAALALAAVTACAGDALNDWQRFPSHNLCRSDMDYGLPNRIARAGAPRKPHSGKPIPVPLHAAGLAVELIMPEAEGTPRLQIGLPVGAQTTLYGRYLDRVPPQQPIWVPWNAGAVGCDSEGPFELLEQEADWAHGRFLFQSQDAKKLSGKDADEADLIITCSRLTPAVLIEIATAKLSLFGGTPLPAKGLRFAARSEAGVKIDELKPDANVLPELSDGWLLLIWERQNPLNLPIEHYPPGKLVLPQDRAPVLLVFSESPMSAAVGDGIEFEFFEAGNVKAAVMPLYGMEFSMGKQQDAWMNELPKEAAERCDWWAARLAKYPLTAEESYAYDAAADKVSVVQTVRYIELREGGKPLAPAPPMVALAAAGGLPVEYSAAVVDCDYRTPFGPYCAADGAESISWSVKGLGKYLTPPAIGETVAESKPLEDELAEEVDKILAAGPLAPWVYTTLYWGGERMTAPIYWRTPAENIYFLAQLMPLLDAGRREKLRDYMRGINEAFPILAAPAMPVFLDGARRERYDFFYRRDGANLPEKMCAVMEATSKPAEVMFASVRGLAELYAATGDKPGPEVWEKASGLLRKSLEGLDWATGCWCVDLAPEIPPESRPGGFDLELPAQLANRQLGALAGYLRLAKLCGRENSPAAALAWGMWARMLATRLALAKYARWAAPPDGPVPINEKWYPRGGADQVRAMNQFEVNLQDDTQNWAKSVFVAFLELTHETGAFLRDYALAESSAFLEAVDRTWPQWHIANISSEIGGDLTSGLCEPINPYSLFVARAWIMRDAPQNLLDRLDISWCARGDLFYLHKLAETIKAFRSVAGE